jgi:hypothetical protein
MRLIGAAAVLAGCAISSIAQVSVWPERLALPADTARADTARTSGFQTEQMVYPGSYQNTERAWVSREDAALRFSQLVAYQIKQDFWLSNLTKNRYADLSGMLAAKNVGPVSYLGADWVPTIMVRRSENSFSTMQANVDAGPVIGMELGGFPVSARGGIAARGWYDSLPDDPRAVDYNAVHGRTGMYGSLQLGDAYRRVLWLPLGFTGSFYGRTPQGARLVDVNAASVACVPVPTGDSLFACFSESFRNGRDINLGEDSLGRLQLRTDESSLRQGLSVQSGLKGRPRYGVVPALVYGFSSVVDRPGRLRDVRTRANRLSIMGWSDSLFGLDYEGGIGFGWTNEDHLFDARIENGYDSILADIQDLRSLTAEMNHYIARYFDNGLGFNYRYDISAYRADYPTTHELGGNPDSLAQRTDDRDQIFHRHQLSLSVLPFTKATLSLTGEYITNILNYIRAEKSAQNNTERQYRTGATAVVMPVDPLTVTADLSAAARVGSYQFPAYLRGTGKFPAYSRTFLSLLTTQVTPLSILKLQAKGGVEYRDNGYWYGRAYRDSLADDLSIREYYAVEDRQRTYEALLSTAFMLPDSSSVETGCDGRMYRRGTYALWEPDVDYTVVPFIRLRAMLWRHVRLLADVRYKFDTTSDDYWDVRALGSVVF